MAVKMDPFILLFPGRCVVCDEIVNRPGGHVCDSCKTRPVPAELMFIVCDLLETAA